MNAKRRATIDDVAQLAGVSIKTVSRVTNREPNVRESTREKVQAAITKLNYRPNISARSLASLRSHFIVLVYDDPSPYDNPSGGYILRLQQGALRACSANNYELLIHPGRARKRDLALELKSLIERARPEGIILAAPLSNIPKVVDAISSTGTPLVQLSPGKDSANRYSISTNDREISAEMTRYLASLGHQRIAFITGHRSHKAVGNRFLGYKDGLRQSGLKFFERLVRDGDNSIASGEAAAAELLDRKSRPTAIFAANDDMAAGVIRIAASKDIDVPGQLSVAGCDDISIARHIFPALTTIRQPLATMTERAACVLIEDAGNGSALHGSEVFPASLQIRESTGPAPD
ncbi:MAG: LacI family DNA-binding transcriptional regulator [Gammaproteobacteria bacterium]|nr:LacI family DNA-binding transcriptional regulator [Gammaproteobacteria bacterium]